MLDLWNKFDKEKKKLFKMGRKLAGSLVPDGDDEDDEEDASKDGGGGGNKKNKKKGKMMEKEGIAQTRQQ
ncbi:hypothetical protein OESDEN_17983 [Oesophagostomum dentatum]|uniref:Uncharacterized protein n=1 Tax=Oesophagostomum dentatum TaxID=61180 RepID=A0A0B1SBL9_OESDE|nr:hypothetical protein OESDEN_17983 [Oesophagostomum dentatum]